MAETIYNEIFFNEDDDDGGGEGDRVSHNPFVFTERISAFSDIKKQKCICLCLKVVYIHIYVCTNSNQDLLVSGMTF
jgi:hypothetical protein